jgi:hypothetical protein
MATDRTGMRQERMLAAARIALTVAAITLALLTILIDDF